MCGAFLVPLSRAGKFMRAKPQIIKRINHKAPLMRQVPPDVHYCGTWWPLDTHTRRAYVTIGLAM